MRYTQQARRGERWAHNSEGALHFFCQTATLTPMSLFEGAR